MAISAEELSLELRDIERTIAGVIIRPARSLARPNSMLIYGRPKSGKTHLAASIREVEGFNKVLHIDFEMGSAAFAKKYPDIDVATIMPENIKDFLKIMAELANDNALGYDAVIIDTLDTAQDMFKQYDMEQSDLTKATYDTWEHIKTWTMRIAWALHRLPCLGILVVHDRTDTDQSTGKITTMANLQSTARHTLPSVSDINAYLSIDTDNEGNDVRVLRLAPSERMHTGNRFEDKLPKLMGNPSMKKIYAKIDSDG